MNDVAHCRAPALSVTGSRYSAVERRTAAGQFVVVGNVERVAQACSIPARTIRDWTRQPWWTDLIAEVRREKQDELDGAFTEAIDSAVEALKDRIRHGDHVFVNGELRRRPISARDAALVAAITFDKRQLLRQQPTAINENTEDHLRRLANRLTGLLQEHRARTIEGEGTAKEQ